MKIRKKAFVLFVFASLILTTLAIASVSAPTTASISAPNIYDITLTPGSSFSIEITVADVEKLWGFELVLSWGGIHEPDCLDVVDVEPLNGFGVNPWTTEEEIGAKRVFVAYTRMFGDSTGFSTVDPAPIVKVDFTVTSEGSTFLRVRDSVLANVYGQIVNHERLNGYFSNIEPGTAEPSCSLAEKKAWPEKRKWKVSADPDLTLTGRVVNDGFVNDLAVKVTFDITFYDGTPYAFETGTATLDPWEKIDLSTTITMADLGELGAYYAFAQAWYEDPDNPGTWIQDGKTQHFNFVAS